MRRAQLLVSYAATQHERVARALFCLYFAVGVFASIGTCVDVRDTSLALTALRHTRLPERSDRKTSLQANDAVEKEDLEKLRNIQHDELLVFEARHLHLDSTIPIDAWNIEIRGAAGGTTVYCPPRVPGFIIQSSNVTLFNLAFVECKGLGALNVDGMKLVSRKDTQTKMNNSVYRRRPECAMEMFVRQCNFSSNEAHYGSALFVNMGCLEVTGSRFLQNHATHGGSILLSDSVATIEDSLFENNKAEFGAAIFAENSTLTVRKTNFNRNVADHYGGALYLDGKHPLTAEGCAFQDNSARSGGGCIRAYKSDVNISSSKFSNSTSLKGAAVLLENDSHITVKTSIFERHNATKGGCFYAETSTASIESSKFRSNYATDGGVVHSEGSTFSIKNSTFVKNRAGRKGGAVMIQDKSQLNFTSSTFEENSADLGGSCYAISSVITLADTTLTSNNATTGGALYLAENAQLLNTGGLDAASHFRKNEAVCGGGIYCETCWVQLDHPVVFAMNVAKENGGGAYFVNMNSGSHLSTAAFKQNVAAFGGALAVKNPKRFKLGDLSKYHTNFSDNAALDGGALHVVLDSDHDETFEFENCHLESNRATTNATALRKDVEFLDGGIWGTSREERFVNAVHQRRLLLDDAHGRGGGFFVALHNLDPDSHVILKITNATVQKNTAKTGGGGFVESDRKDFEWKRGEDCHTDCTNAERCRCAEVRNLLIAANSASGSGGGVFMASPRSFLFCDESRPQELAKDWNCASVRDNTLSEENDGYGKDAASDATSLELNVKTPLANLSLGDKLAVPCSKDTQDSCRPAEITVTVKDIFGQTIVGGCTDSELTILLDADLISGKRNYTVHSGEVSIDSTFIAGVGVNDVELFFRPADERDFFVRLNFSILPCANGEFPDKEEKRCVRCPRFSYTLNASEDGCTECEAHAVCDGTAALVPVEGYWHCSPFSPFMIRCLHKKACTYPSRTKTLVRFYSNSTHTLQLLAALEAQNCTTLETQDRTEYVDLGNYTQCADGYEGPACGSCASGYGHNADGSCSRCSLGKIASRVFTTLFALVLFGVVTVKLVLTVNDMRTQAIFERKGQRRDTAIRLAREHVLQPEPGTSSRTIPYHSISDEALLLGRTSTQESHLSSEITGDEMQQPEHQPRNCVPPPSLARTDPVRNPEKSDDEPNEPSSEMMQASTALSDTFNILFNYAQLNTVALTADIAWKGAMRSWLSIQASLGRAFNGKILPFDCCFPNWNKSGGIPKSLLTLWYRTAFPLATMALYLFFIAVRRQFGDEELRQDVFSLPAASSVVLIVYLSFSIDIFANLLRVMHCKNLISDNRQEHHITLCETVPHGELWTGDTEVPCWKGAHFWSAVAAIVGLLCSIVVLVLIVKIVKCGKSGQELRKPKFIMDYGFLYLAYRQEGLALYWEAIITLRKMLLATVGEFGKYKEMSGAQIGQSAMIILAFLVLHEIVKPFNYFSLRKNFPSYAGNTFRLIGGEGLADRWNAFNQSLSLNGLEGASLAMSLTIFLTAGCVNDDKTSSIDSNILISVCFLLNVLFVLFMLYRLCYGAHHCLDVLASEKGLCSSESHIFVNGRAFNLARTFLLCKAWIVLRAKTQERANYERESSLP